MRILSALGGSWRPFWGLGATYGATPVECGGPDTSTGATSAARLRGVGPIGAVGGIQRCGDPDASVSVYGAGVSSGFRRPMVTSSCWTSSWSLRS
jgi:hypothetical protein